MSDRGIWGIRIFLTIVLAVVCIAAWSIGSLFYIDEGECYYINNPNKEVLGVRTKSWTHNHLE